MVQFPRLPRGYLSAHFVSTRPQIFTVLLDLFRDYTYILKTKA